uniref:D-isomer specific 2-hydroxyacid dehydrogenase NAD-binding domain-containing protein n=1 Tax=Chenopodium quinoa TaxID=63459 RepID=A0A803LQV4_CHEQI
MRKDTLDCLPSLEFIVTSCVGIDHIDLSECRRRGISVANIGDAFSDDVADCAVGLLIDVLRKVSAAHRFVRAGSWPELEVFPLGSRFLVDGRIRGAGLDVFQNEPYVPKELFGLDNVVLSPHQAFFTPDSFKAAEDISVANLEAFFSNKPLISPIRRD